MEGLARLRSVLDPRLALAVIALAPDLHQARRAEALGGPARLLRRGRPEEPHRGRPHLVEEALFLEAVLRHRQRPGAWGHLATEVDQPLHRGGWHVLELEGDDVGGLGQGLEPLCVVIGGGDLAVGDLGGRAAAVRVQHHGFQAEPGRRHRQHAPKLAAAHDADGVARLQGERRHSG